MDVEENGKSQTELNRLERLLLPGKKFAEADEELRRVLKIGYQIGYIAVIPLCVLGLSSLILHETVLGTANISFALLLAGYLEFYRRSDIDFDTVVVHVLAATGAYFLFVAFFSGVERPTILWSYLYPLAAFAFLGGRRGTAAVIIYFAAVFSMFMADPHASGITHYETGLKFVFSISYPLVSILSYFYEDQRAKYQISLRSANEVMERRIYERTAELARSEEKYRAIIENMEEGYFEVDLAGRVTFFNESARKFLGYSPEESMGLHYQKYMDGENAKKVFNLYSEVYKTRVPQMDFDWEVIRKDGTRSTVAGSASLISDADGKPTVSGGCSGTRRNASGCMRRCAKASGGWPTSSKWVLSEYVRKKSTAWSMRTMLISFCPRILPISVLRIWTILSISLCSHIRGPMGFMKALLPQA